MGFKYAKNTLAAGTQLGELTTLPRPLSRLGRGHQSQCPSPPRRLNSRTIGTLIIVPPMETWCHPPLI